VIFSILCAWGSVALVRAYIFQTCVANGSSLASVSGSSATANTGAFKSGDPDNRGEVYELASCSDNGTPCGSKISSANISVNIVDFESAVTEGFEDNGECP
jgi:hypothetical protein